MEDNRAAANGEILKLLQDEIKLIFRDPDARETDEHKNVDPEAMINYTTYLMRVNKQALLKRQEGKEKRKIMMKDAKDK